MVKNIVHVIGTGTIGEPLIGLLTAHAAQFGIDEVTFHKNQALSYEKAKVNELIKKGARLAVNSDKVEDFEKLGHHVSFTQEEAIGRATVVIDCTPKGFGKDNKTKYYDKYKDKVKGFLAQGSETGFGKPFAYHINNEALTNEDQFIQVVSCNTHNICSLVKAFFTDFSQAYIGDFVCIRRASDISQNEDFSPGVEVDIHKDSTMGTHHAVDAKRVFDTLLPQNDLPYKDSITLHSSSCIVPTQYMHTIRFKLWFTRPLTKEQVIESFNESKLIATTEKLTSNSIFSFGRDHGFYGRILNQTVIALPTLDVVTQTYGTVVTGFCFTPQDANSLLSSVAGTLWFLHNKDWKEVNNRISALDPYLFKEI